MKTFARWSLYILAMLLVLAALCACGFVAWMHHSYLRTDSSNVAYLKQHKVGSGPLNGPLLLNLPASLLRKRLILLSEIHGSAAPQTIDLALLKQLNASTGLTHYVAEVDPAEAAAFNHYLESGDEREMRAVFDLWTPDAQWGNCEFEDKVRSIRAYNAGLDPARRIRFVGLDAVQDFPFAARFVASATGTTLDPAWLTALDLQKRKDAARMLLDWWADKPALLAENAAALDALRFTLHQTAESRSIRDEHIFNNYRFQVEHGELREGQAYGMWGMFHGLQAEAAGVMPFAARVRQSALPAAGNMATIFAIGVDSGMMMPSGALPVSIRPRHAGAIGMPFSADGPMLYVKGIEDLKDAAPEPGKITLFQLDAAGSPYSKGLIFGPHWAAMGTIPFTRKGASSTDYTQYVAFFRDSAAVTQRKQGE